jgi:hypothetical protein
MDAVAGDGIRVWLATFEDGHVEAGGAEGVSEGQTAEAAAGNEDAECHGLESPVQLDG